MKPELLTVIVAISGPIIALGGTLLGVWVGHHLSVRRSAGDRIATLRDQHVLEFLAAAYTNLRYLWPPGPESPKPNPTAGNMADFSVLGNRAGLYVSDESEKAILEYTSKYAGALLRFNETNSQQVSDLKPELDKLKDRLRAELRRW